MPSLQKKLSYGGDLRSAPVTDINLEFKVPVYKYFRVDAERGDDDFAVDRKLVGTESVVLAKEINSKDYQLVLGEDFVVGKDRASLSKVFISKSLTEKKLENFFVELEVHYFADLHLKVGEESLKLIYFPKLDASALSRGESDDAVITLILINRESFFTLMKQLEAASAPLDHMYLLAIISFLTEIREEQPTRLKKISPEAKKLIFAQRADDTVDDPAKALDIIRGGFDSLFDFPLTIPEIRAVTLAGTFTISTSDGSQISRDDLGNYDLSAEYVTSGTGKPTILHYGFLEKKVKIQKNSVRFSFSDDRTILANSIASSIVVKVQALDGSTPWLREFKAADPALSGIEIEVPLQRRNSVGRLDEGTVVDRTKRLRGQVLELSKKCSLKDITVVVQARNTGDTVWKVVGAATTDSSGNFSMAYPFGTYTEAEAIVSLTPDHPAVIAMNASKDGNQTISDDFLYLLLRDVECRPVKAAEDCDCEAPKKAARLPDYADLIESDEYSQDIGGACVNLSTPNRTLSEFNYQAVVRTSDPDVANYTLKKVEKRAADVSIALNALTASNAAANSAVKVLTALNADLNAALSPLDANSNAASSAVASALNAVLGPLNAALHPLIAAPNAAVSAASSELNVASNASDQLNAALNAAITQLNGALSASTAAARDALHATLSEASVPARTDLLGTLLNVASGGAHASRSPNFFSAWNAALAASSPAHAVKSEALTDALNVALAASNQALSAALAAANAALKVALNLASAVAAADVETSYDLIGGVQKRQRNRVDLNNPIAWQDVPESPEDKKNLSFYQAVTIATGHILHYKSLFKADGYSLGDLVYSLPLAPGQKKEIVVFDSSHTLQGSELQSLSQVEKLAAGIASERDVTSQLGGNLSEAMRGSSFANTSGISAGFGTGGSGSGGTGAYGGSGSAVLGVAGGVANSNSSASQQSSRDVSQFFGEKLRQSIMQNAEGYRQLNATVVTTVQEGQRYGVTSEVVANHNHCHALTMMYFEVLRHYAVFQKLSGVEECVFVPLLMTNFSTQNIYKWRDVLAQLLLPMPSETYLRPSSSSSQPYSQTWRDHPLLKAFDANERIKTRYANVDFPDGAYDDEVIRFIKGDMLLRVDLPRPRTRYDRIKSLPVTSKTVVTKEIDPVATAKRAVTDSILQGASMGLYVLFNPAAGTNTQYTTTEHQVLVKTAIFDAFMSLDANYESVPPAQCIRVTNFNPTSISVAGLSAPVSGLDFFLDGGLDKSLWTAYASILGYSDVLKMLDYYFKGQLIAEWDDIFYNELAPIIFDRIISSLKITPIATDFTSETRYKGGEKLVRLNLTATTTLKRNQLPLQLKMSASSPAAMALKDFVTLTIENTRIFYSTAHYNGILFSGSVNDDLLDETTFFIPENAEEKRNPRKEDSYLVYKLIEHLNSNLEHYNKVLWHNLDPDRRYMLLDGFNIQIFNEAGDPNGLRSLASVVKNDLITVTGNSLVFPVAAGYKVSRDYVVEQTEEEQTRVTLLDHYKPLTPIEPYRISVPSKGVFAEAVQGACNACEKIETDRLQDWNRFPNIDEPTPISPITAPIPATTDWKAVFKEFATPVVNIQNAPALPVPGAGLSGLSEVLAKSGVFKDVTGLEGNQQNVLQTYLSNQENAKAFAQMAKEMAMQSHNTQNSGRISDSLKAAKDGGALNQDEYSTLVKDHLQQQIDGGQTKQAELEQQKQVSSALTTNAVDTALTQGADVEAQISDGQGRKESFNIRHAAFDYEEKKTTAPAHKTGLSKLANEKGEATPFVERVLSESKSWIDAVADGIVEWRDSPSTELKDAVGSALVEAAKVAAAKATDDIPLVQAMKVAVKYSLVFAKGVGIGIDDASRSLSAKYEKAIALEAGTNGYDDDGYKALQFVRKYQLNNVNELQGIVLKGASAVVDAALQDVKKWAGAALVKKFSSISKSLVSHLLDKSPLKAAIYGALEVGGKGIDEKRQEIYRAVLSTSLSLFIRQLSDPKLRTSLNAYSKLGGKDPLGKAILKATASCLVDTAMQDKDIKQFGREVKTETRAWIVQRLKELIDALDSGVSVVPTNGKLDVVGDEVRIPTQLLQEIQIGAEGLAEQDYRKSMNIHIALEEVRKATEGRLTLLSRARQPKAVLLAKSGIDPELGSTAYEKYWAEIRQQCSKLSSLYRAAGASRDSSWDSLLGIRFEIFNIQSPMKWYIQHYRIMTAEFATPEVIWGERTPATM